MFTSIRICAALWPVLSARLVMIIFVYCSCMKPSLPVLSSPLHIQSSSLTVVTGEIWPQCTEISGWQGEGEGEGERGPGKSWGSPSDEAHDLAISHLSQSLGGPQQAPGRGKHENCREDLEHSKLSEMFLNNIPLLSSDLIGSYWIISDESDISIFHYSTEIIEIPSLPFFPRQRHSSVMMMTRALATRM